MKKVGEKSENGVKSDGEKVKNGVKSEREKENISLKNPKRGQKCLSRPLLIFTYKKKITMRVTHPHLAELTLGRNSRRGQATWHNETVYLLPSHFALDIYSHRVPGKRKKFQKAEYITNFNTKN